MNKNDSHHKLDKAANLAFYITVLKRQCGSLSFNMITNHSGQKSLGNTEVVDTAHFQCVQLGRFLLAIWPAIWTHPSLWLEEALLSHRQNNAWQSHQQISLLYGGPWTAQTLGANHNVACVVFINCNALCVCWYVIMILGFGVDTFSYGCWI